MITTNQFHNYLISLDLWKIEIMETSEAFYAILTESDKPNLSDFTQVSKNQFGKPLVRLSKKDIHNEAITKGFFTV
jgi:hypothetical protein